MDATLIRALAARRTAERGPGTRLRNAPLRILLVYPSPYEIAMSSLGYLGVLRRLAETPGVQVERAMLPAAADRARHRDTRTPLLSLESQTPASEFDVLAFSLAYELELAGLVGCLDLAGLPLFARDRGAEHPLVILGGPLTFSNPLPAAPFADLVFLGEAEGTLAELLPLVVAEPNAAKGEAGARARLVERMNEVPGVWAPALGREWLPPIAKAPDHLLPAHSSIWTPDTELSDMFLIEPERGCHRGCTFCVMRRSTNGGMRALDAANILSLVPDDAPRVGLVGAAVTDHPELAAILTGIVREKGKGIGVSSLRADRLDDEIVGLLAAGGYRSITVALDAASRRLRHDIEKILKEEHVLRAAELARAHGMRHLKIYVVVGLPGETDDDRLELVELVRRLTKTIPVALGVSPLVPKFHTPLATAPFVGEAEADRILKELKRALGGIAEVRGPGAREAYVEYRLAQGGFAHADAVVAAARAGGGLGAFRRALLDLPERISLSAMPHLVPSSRLRPRAAGP